MKKSRNKELVISKNISAPLKNVPFHSGSGAIQRTIPEKFPVYVAVHSISSSALVPDKDARVILHKHDAPEINMLISENGKLRYEIRTDNNIYEVESPSCVYIPAGVQHAADYVSGTGSFICVFLSEGTPKFEACETQDKPKKNK